eukprot:3636368-Prymnesium_polylepis.1
MADMQTWLPHENAAKRVQTPRHSRLYWNFYTWTEKTEKPVQNGVARDLLNAWLLPVTQPVSAILGSRASRRSVG